jgi:hypothetical protein
MVAFVVFGTFVLSIILNGFVLQVLWGWFITPFGLPAISIPQGLGLALVVGFLTHQYQDNKRSPEGVITYSIMSPVVSLVFGWVVHLFL